MPPIDPQKRIKELEAALLAARAGVEDTLKTLQSRLEETRAEKDKFEKTVVQRAKERDAARKERDELKAQVEELEKKLAAAAAAQRAAPKGPPPVNPAPLKAKIAELEGALAKAKEQIAALEYDLEQAKAAPPAPAAPPVQIGEDSEVLHARIAELERQLELSTARPEDSVSTDEKVAELEHALFEEREQNAPLREEIARLKERVRSLEAEVKTARPAVAPAPPNKGREVDQDEVAKLQARIAELERASELAPAPENGVSADARVQELEKKLEDVREQNAPLQEELAKAKDRIRALEKQVEGARPEGTPLPSL